MKDGSEKTGGLRIEPLLGITALLLLLAGCVYVLKPFLSAVMWAMILAYTLYPLQRMFTRWFRGSRTLAAIFVTITVTVVLAGPVVWIGVRLAKDGRDLGIATREWVTSTPSEPPAWFGRIPMLGDELSAQWTGFSEMRARWLKQIDKEVKEVKNPPRATIVPEAAGEESVSDQEIVPPVGEVSGVAADPIAAGVQADKLEEKEEHSQVIALFGRFLAKTYQWMLAIGLAVGQGVAQVLISAFLAFFLLRDSVTLSARLGVVVQRLAGERGRHLIQVAGATVRGVIYGILGTALAQSVVAWLGFWVAGVPGAVLLAVLTFFFAVVPFGPPMIWVPASLWLFANEMPGMGAFMLLWGGLAISSVDNILRPFLISQGSKMPFALIFCGVIGGALAFGLVGVFLGPTLLAVVYRLIDEWSSPNPGTPAAEPALISVLQEASDCPTPPPHGS